MSELRKQIADALGWKFVPRENQTYEIYRPDGTQHVEIPKDEPHIELYAFSAALWLMKGNRLFPNWDTDLNAAWQLLEHVAKEHGAHDIELRWGHSEMLPSCRINNAKLDIRVRKLGATPALAICKAFIAFMEKVKEDSPTT